MGQRLQLAVCADVYNMSRVDRRLRFIQILTIPVTREHYELCGRRKRSTHDDVKLYGLSLDELVPIPGGLNLSIVLSLDIDVIIF